MPGVALQARSVTKRYGTVVALDGVSVDVADGECLALVGESGSGKSTLLRTFNALTRPDAGDVMVDGIEVGRADPVSLRRSVGYVPQDGGLLPHWTVRRNAGLVPWLDGRADHGALAERALDMVGLSASEFGARWPRELSGGQRQRVAFARALAAGPRLVLLDEPFGALDAITRGDLQSMFLSLRARTGLTAVLVTHDLHEACLLADRVAVMFAGRIEQCAAPAVLLEAPATPYVRSLLVRARMLEAAS
ncbi:MAG: ATP-binding cassette domain-containing protein [Vicinamibacterales bacterium]